MNSLDKMPVSHNEAQEDTDLEKRVRRAWERGRDTFEHNGKRIEFFGVEHIPRTLEIYREQIVSGIQNVDCVVSEAPPSVGVQIFIDFFNNQESYVATDSEGNIISIEDFLRRAISENENLIFFNAVADIIHEQEKAVFTSDPVVPDNALGLVSTLLKNDPDKADKEIESIRTVIGGTALGLAFMQFLSMTFQKNPKMNRRNFLKFGAAGSTVAVGSLMGMSNWGKRLSGEDSGGFDRTDSLGFSTYSFRDYRDVSIARGIDVMTRSNGGLNSIAVIYGADHTAPVRYYLENPRERELRYAVYKSYREKFPAPLVQYSPNTSPEGEKWLMQSQNID